MIVDTNMTEEEILNNNTLTDKEKVELLKALKKSQDANKTTMEGYGYNSDDVILTE